LDPSGIAALNHEVTRQAAMIGYIDDFALMLIVILASLPLLLLVRVPRREPAGEAAEYGVNFRQRAKPSEFGSAGHSPRKITVAPSVCANPAFQ
jgi:hypothetical protein